MKASYRWLLDMVPGLDMTPEAMGDHLGMRGAPLEGIAAPGEGLRDVVMGRVITARQHPNADRLSLCTVDGGDGVKSVVCGAPNVKAGAWYPFAPVGAVLPGDFKIDKAKIRGEVSEGMLCSAKELGLGADHAGILEIEGDFTPGEPFVRAIGLDDVTLDIEVTPNRGDLLSHIGVARELAGEGAGAVRLPRIPGAPGIVLDYARAVEAPEPANSGGAAAAAQPASVTLGDVTIEIRAPDLCSAYLGAVIRGVKIGASPAWLQARLRGAGARPINNVVDATNYVMLELGQPLHAFDLSNLAGSSIVVRRAGTDEKTFTTLDEEEREIGSDMLMICDAERPVAIAGVMGGLHSEVSDDTVDVLLECAHFEPKSIRATRRALGMSTDASYRFERGVDPCGMRAAVERAVELILATAGGEVDGAVLDCNARAVAPTTTTVRLSRIEHLLGVAIDSATVRGYLEELGFEITGEEDGVLSVAVPGFRSYDVTREVDLIEEVARVHGYDSFPDALGPYRPGTVPDHPLFQLEDALRRDLAARGLYEAQTPSFVPEGEGDVRVANPLATTEPFMRRAILPSLIRRLEYNLARGNRDVRFFEIGTSFQKRAAGEPPHEETHLAAVLTGLREPPHWSREAEPIGVWDLKGLLEDTVRRAYGGAGSVRVGGEPREPFRAGSAFEVVGPDGEGWGHGGLVRPDAVDTPVWAGDVWGFELRLPPEPEVAPPVLYEPLPQFPAVERDVALLVPAGVSAEAISASVRAHAEELLEDVALFDRYVGDELGEGVVSLAFRLRFRAPERTLKDNEVDRTMSKILAALEEELGVGQRG